MSRPTVAVIVTCYNQERYIRQALDSIVAQTQPADEIVVIDGFSHDRSVEAIEQWISENDTEITFVAHDRNYGLCATLNQAMDLISSEFVVTLYGDDWLSPDRLRGQSAILAASSPDVCMVVGSMREVTRRGVPIVDHDFTDRIQPLIDSSPTERVERLVTANTIPSPAVMLRSALVRAVGGYDESLTFDDYDMWMRLLSTYTLVFDPTIVVNYRVLDNSLSRNTDRHGDFLLSEAKMIFKHVGTTPRIDEIIRGRLVASGQKLADRGDSARLRVLVDMLRQVDPSWRVRIGAWAALTPRGAQTVRKMRLLENHAL